MLNAYAEAMSGGKGKPSAPPSNGHSKPPTEGTRPSGQVAGNALLRMMAHRYEG